MLKPMSVSAALFALLFLPGCSGSGSGNVKAPSALPSPSAVAALATETTAAEPVDSSTPILAADAEISPDEFAKEMGLPLDDGDPTPEGFGISRNVPMARAVAPQHFKDFRVNVDIFRKSTRRPVLGDFREEFTAALVPNAEGLTPESRTEEAKKRFAILASREFAVASLDGAPFKAYIISGAVEKRVAVALKNPDGTLDRDPETGRIRTRMSMKTTPVGNYRLDAIAYDLKLKGPKGMKVVRPVAFPWLRSHAYKDSQMFWGLWIKGGYFIHSTPHYGELGRPASMGCIRQSFADAQELFKLIVEENLSGMVRIHRIGASESVSRLREIIVDLAYSAPPNAPVTEAPRDPSKDMTWLLTQLASNEQRIRDSVKYYGHELNIAGNDWINAETGKPGAVTWPKCGDIQGSPVDCFKTWGVKKPKNSLN